VIKMAVIAPATLEHVLDVHLRRVASGRIEGASELIACAVRVKADVVSLDEREVGQRAALNLGHTLGHALEGATGYRSFLHGEAVGWGLLAALRLARDRGFLATTSAQAWATRLALTAPWPSLSGLSWESLAPYLSRDKKRASGRIGWVLPRVGGVVLDVQIEAEEVEIVFRELQSLAPIGPFTVLL
jgi:3-dehydroquinate synthase